MLLFILSSAIKTNSFIVLFAARLLLQTKDNCFVIVLCYLE